MRKQASTKTAQEIANMISPFSYYNQIRRLQYDCDWTHVMYNVTGTDAESVVRRLKSIGAKYVKSSGRGYYKDIRFRLEADDAEIAAAAEKKRREDERAAKLADITGRLNAAQEQYGFKGFPWRLTAEQFLRGVLDLDKLVDYCKEPVQPTNKDETRIYDIIRKSQARWARRFCIASADYCKMYDLVTQMNNKIKDDYKRFYRAQACLKYGLPGLAKIFQPNEQLVA